MTTGSIHFSFILPTFRSVVVWDLAAGKALCGCPASRFASSFEFALTIQRAFSLSCMS